MARRKEAPKRDVTPDPKFGSESLAKFINVLMRSGKKSTAEKIVYGALTLIAERSKTDPLEVYKTAIENVRPLVEVKSRRVGGATYRCRLRYARRARPPWPCAGSPRPRARAARSPWARGWPPNSWKPRNGAGPP